MKTEIKVRKVRTSPGGGQAARAAQQRRGTPLIQSAGTDRQPRMMAGKFSPATMLRHSHRWWNLAGGTWAQALLGRLLTCH